MVTPERYTQSFTATERPSNRMGFYRGGLGTMGWLSLLPPALARWHRPRRLGPCNDRFPPRLSRHQTYPIPCFVQNWLPATLRALLRLADLF